MDSYEATRMVFSRIQNLDPENSSKIMGYLLIQDHGEKEMIRLAFGPEALIHSLIAKAKTHLGIPSNTSSTPSTPSSSSPSPFQRPNPLVLNASGISNNVNGFDITNPSSPSTHWPLTDLRSPTYANIVNGTSNPGSGSGSLSSTTVSSLTSAFPYYNNASSFAGNCNDFIDDYQLQDQPSFLNDSKADDLFDPRLDLAVSPGPYGESPLHRRSFSVPGMCFGSEDMNSGFGWKPCLYFARGFCKNGSSCRFLHGDSADPSAIVGSPSKLSEFEQCQEILRSKAAAQQKLAAASQFMAGASFPYNKCMNYFFQQQSDSQRWVYIYLF